MTKRILAALFMLVSFTAKAQYNNEWIDFSKPYFKFKVGAPGIYRIPQSLLQTSGLGSIPAEQFQLWRNGQQVPVYSSVATGAMGSSDFLEFYGQYNDGKPDNVLYADPNAQHSDKWSLFTDTSVYFLTYTSTSSPARLSDAVNNVAGNLLPAEPYFIHTYGRHIRDKINPGRAAVVGEYVYSSSFETGEGWSSRDIYVYSPILEPLSNLYPFSGGPAPKLRVIAAGNALNIRTVDISVNNFPIVQADMNYFTGLDTTVGIFPGVLGTPNDSISIYNGSAINSDRMVVHGYEIIYPRQFNFGGASKFEFDLPAKASGNFLVISNFNNSGVAPVLYDLTNGARYMGDIAVAGQVRFALPPGGARSFVLASTATAEIQLVTSLTQKNFIDFTDPVRQGDYLIVSNSRLFNGPNGDAVENYRLYRSSGPGGGYNAKVYDIDELTDQFAFGIKRNPLSVKNFLRFARAKFGIKPQYVFLIGRGVNYNESRPREAYAGTATIDLIPTFGSPGSDNILASDGYDPIPETPEGRLAAVTGKEVEDYLAKVKQHATAMQSGSQTVKDRGWMKNVVHAIGGSDPYLQAVIYGYMNVARDIIQDTLMGANVSSFSKNSALSVQQINSAQLQQLFSDGLNLVTYFGHSSANTLEFNLDDPSVYTNVGKYPFFMINGCNAGNIFFYDTLRYSGDAKTLSEKYVLADQKGSIGCVASSHYGIVNYLNLYVNSMYKQISDEGYGKTLGQQQQAAIKGLLDITGTSDYFGRVHAEESTLHGDPAVPMYSFAKPDYDLEDQYLDVNPDPVSVADNSFKLDIKYFNLGRVLTDSFFLEVRRTIPGGASQTIYRKKVPPVHYMDSLSLTVPVNPLTDKGENKITVTLDPDNTVSEISESNNTITKTIYIIEEEARPISPYNYSIVNSPNMNFYASAANPFSVKKDYVFEVDTTELFNSPSKKTQTISANGGLLQFNPPGFSLQDSTVYYWRTAPTPVSGGQYVWNNSSFLYLTTSTPGYAQGHYYQFLKNNHSGLSLQSDRQYRYDVTPRRLNIRTGLYPYFDYSSIDVTLDEDYFVRYGCRYSSVQIVVYDSVTLKPWTNNVQSNGLGLFGSWPPCGTDLHAFEFPYADTSFRRKAVEFLESIPSGDYVSITNLGYIVNTSFVADWMSDTARLGSGRSLYHVMKNMGMVDIDQFTRNLPFLFFLRKGDPNYPIYGMVGPEENSHVTQSFTVFSRGNKGTIESPWFGPSTNWQGFHWKGQDKEVQPDQVLMDLYGKDFLGNESFLARVDPSRDTSLSFVNTKAFPYLRVVMQNNDTVNATPNQLRYLRFNGVLPPEGTVAPNLLFQAKDTLDVGEVMDFKVAFKNISGANFDSLDVLLKVTDNGNLVHTQTIPKQKPLASQDTLSFNFKLNTKDYVGHNTLFLDFNPNNAQPEQYLFNNFLFKDFYVRSDKYNPTLDVTFDGVHILNRDIVSSKPHVAIQLKDNSKYLFLTDTSVMSVKIKMPDGSLKSYRFDGDTLRFTPATVDPGSSKNTAQLDFNPSFLEDGEYELIVTGKDVSGNKAGQIAYNVVFTVVNKPMISNLLNYPNPFTTQTAFVFTLTGSELPSEFKIQILTVTGKIVREITRAELGSIHIGRNITDFKWDGTDQFGQKLGNGVYLYRVVTSLHGKQIDRYKASGDDTDKYFNNGYGKMYLMR